MSSNHIFAKPIEIKGIGKIYPVKLTDYDEFSLNAGIFTYSYEHFKLEEVAKEFETTSDNIKLFDLLLLMGHQQNIDLFLQSIGRTFSICFRKELKLTKNENGRCFIADGCLVDRTNYDQFREVVMKQNLIHSPKVYKNKFTQMWAEKVLASRNKNAPNVSLEDMVTTVAVYSKKLYSDIENYTYYQLRAEFDRIGKMKNYDLNSLALVNPYAKDIKLDYYAENIDMYKNPYDDVFKDKSKLNKLNGAIQK